MKVGVTTIHRVVNYGSALQAFALQTVIEALGHDCEIIDYLYPNRYHREQYAAPQRSPLGRLKEGMRSLIARDLSRKRRFDEFVAGHLRLSPRQYPSQESLRDSPPGYDLYLTGSDQVWNPTYLRHDPTFLLEFAPEGARRASYAASFGNSALDPRYHDLYRACLGRFSGISVREGAGERIVAELTGLPAQQVLDPTLLLSAEQWRSLAVPPRFRERYLLCYFMGYAFDPQPYADLLAREVARRTGCRLVFVTSHLDRARFFAPGVHQVFDAGPREFLGWFSGAEAVLTSSFHGTAFSVIFQKPFLSLVNDLPTLDCRQRNLLEELGLTRQMLPVRSPFPEPSRLYPDYRAVQGPLREARENSLAFLSRTLGAP